MTTFCPVRMKCAVCGAPSEHNQLMSTNTMGWPDLDTRPAEMQRSTIGLWVVQCPGCGYCASDLEKAGANARTTVEGQAYRALLADASYPDLARKFLASALVSEGEGEFNSAGWSALHAAWACDDKKNAKAAVSARNRALALFEQAAAAGQSVFSDGTDARVLTIDLLRRAGRFDEARGVCQECLDAVEAQLLRRILEFQLHLIESGDARCHTVGEAKEWKEGG